ncbi:MAG: hypothetical protein HC853_05445 [Anaerolineae bacterium]|nr:hypothetical protein [Anaerolineae bacterium]
MKMLRWFMLFASLGLMIGTTARATVEAPVGSYASRIACTNIEATEPINKIVIELYNGNADALYTKTDTTPLSAGYTRIYVLTDTNSFSGLASFSGAATVSASRKIACSVTTERTSTAIGSQSVPARMGSHTGSDTQSESGSTLYAPQTMKQFYGWNSYIAVHNNDFYTGSVQISYIDRFGASYPAATETRTVSPQNTTVFDQENTGNLPANLWVLPRLLAAPTVTHRALFP